MQQAFEHLLQLGYPKLTELLEQKGPISIEDRYDPEPWPALIRVVVGQQVSTHAAQAIWTKLEKAAARDFDRLFLDTPSDLEGCGLSRAKVRTLTELLQAKREGTLDLTALSRVPHEERLSRLTPTGVSVLGLLKCGACFIARTLTYGLLAIWHLKRARRDLPRTRTP